MTRMVLVTTHTPVKLRGEIAEEAHLWPSAATSVATVKGAGCSSVTYPLDRENAVRLQPRLHRCAMKPSAMKPSAMKPSAMKPSAMKPSAMKVQNFRLVEAIP
jgi:hypothetical protein